MSSSTDQNRTKIVQDYFRLTDQGCREILELFHEDAEIYFPKFGFGVGRQSFVELTAGFLGSLEFIRHDYDALKIVPAGDYVVVEGTSRGKLSGKTWTGGETPGGRFCNVFKFRGDRLSSVHVSLDPDYTVRMPPIQMGHESQVVKTPRGRPCRGRVRDTVVTKDGTTTSQTSCLQTSCLQL